MTADQTPSARFGWCAMTADLLREAAALMRENAEMSQAGAGSVWSARVQVGGFAWIEPEHLSMRGYQSTARHMASWHPAVALAVALLLENEANAMEPEWLEEYDMPPYNHARARLLTDVARAYLGRAA